VIFIDSNIPMYLVGAEHPNKTPARLLLERAVTSERRLVTDAEVLQEILHRYAAIRRLDAVQPALALLLGVVDDVIPIAQEDVLTARDVLLSAKDISARDALHVAIMRRHEIDLIVTFDRAFDGVPGIRRFGR